MSLEKRILVYILHIKAVITWGLKKTNILFQKGLGEKKKRFKNLFIPA
ncbi:MAG: hypothetical protein KatS3mg090_0001 [Patescibacteria group bacterium]|nr:MAG: hypothetical protein KatS3mg090_0001 [Patescibacteria group bacterium]